MPETSWSFHYWQPAPRWRLHRWLAKPDNPAMSPHAPEKNRNPSHWYTVESRGWGGREPKPLNAPHTMLLLPATLINKRYSPKHQVFHACASILKPLTNWLQSLLVVSLVKLRLTSLNISTVHDFRVARVALGTSILFSLSLQSLSPSIITRHTPNAQPQCICMKLLFYNIYRAASAKEGYADVPKSDSFPMGSFSL